MYKRNRLDDNVFERAIKFLVCSIEKSGNNPKPVILHSVRVGLYLDSLGYKKNVVISGILHDLLEDSKISLSAIEKEFGREVGRLVKANSFDKSVKDRNKRHKETFERCVEAGREALLVKAADIIDNSYYYHLAQSEGDYSWLLKKMRDFIRLSQDLLEKERVYTALLTRYRALKRNQS